MPKRKARRVQPAKQRPVFDAKTFLESAGAARHAMPYTGGKVVFSQGQPSDAVMYIQKGSIKISVLPRTGKEAVVAMLGPGDFFGEGETGTSRSTLHCSTSSSTFSAVAVRGSFGLAHWRITLRNSSACSCNCRIRFAPTARSRQSSAIWPSATSGNSAGRGGPCLRGARGPTTDFGMASLLPPILTGRSADECAVWNAQRCAALKSMM